MWVHHLVRVLDKLVHRERASAQDGDGPREEENFQLFKNQLKTFTKKKKLRA